MICCYLIEDSAFFDALIEDVEMLQKEDLIATFFVNFHVGEEHVQSSLRLDFGILATKGIDEHCMK